MPILNLTVKLNSYQGALSPGGETSQVSFRVHSDQRVWAVCQKMEERHGFPRGSLTPFKNDTELDRNSTFAEAGLVNGGRIQLRN